MKKQQAGFTLIELMISLTLGLLITAAGLSIFLSAQKSIGVQNSISELQQNANFGLAVVTHDIRHANLNMNPVNPLINNKIRGSGIIFAVEKTVNGVIVGNIPSASLGDAKYVTKPNGNGTNSDTASDQLTIQFQPSTVSYINCEGREVSDANQKIIVQRYYYDSDRHALMCDASAYVPANSTASVTNDGTQGANAQQIMQGIDRFKVRFGVYNTASKNYQYKSTVGDNDNVVSVEVGVLARSTSAAAAGTAPASTDTYNIAGTEVKVDDLPEKTKYQYQAVNQIVALRNASGVSQ